MITEELYITTKEGKQRLDLPVPSGITLKWVSNLFNDISKLTCSYSYTFKLPLTSNNRRILECADDLRHVSKFVKKSVPAEFHINGVCLCPNANLYVNELSDSFQCIMTWKVLKAFESLKDGNVNLNGLQSLGKIEWGGNESYGGTSTELSNMQNVVYPDYDAGVPHEDGTPPKPCVPVYKLIQMINEYFGVRFNIGTYMAEGLGHKPQRYLNNANYYQRRVYDDYISNGVLPLVNTKINNDKYIIRGIYGIGTHTMYQIMLECTQEWKMIVFGTGSAKYPFTVRHYSIIAGEYTSLTEKTTDQIQAEYKAPDVMAVGVPVFENWNGNKYVKPIHAFQHDTGLSIFNRYKDEKAIVDNALSDPLFTPVYRWATRTYKLNEVIIDGLTFEKGEPYTSVAEVVEDTTGNNHWGIINKGGGTYYDTKGLTGGDAGKDIGIIGFYSKNELTLKGYCTIRISKEAVDEGRVDVSSYMWMSVAKITKNEETGALELESATDKDIDNFNGFMSIDIPQYDAVTDSYVCHFDFGSSYDIRKVVIDADDDETLQGYVLLPYYTEDHLIEVEIPVEPEEESEEEPEPETKTVLNLKEGDFVIEGLVITELAPTVDVAELPAVIYVTDSLPEISCFEFMKSVFYMNGAMPRVERDGVTISAMYYNQLRDRVNDGEVLDWSSKLLAMDKDLPVDFKYHNTSFATKNYFEMAESQKGKTYEEIYDELDQYGKGFGSIVIEDDVLKDEADIFKAAFYPAYVQNLRYPLLKVGNTCKVWEGDKTLQDNTPQMYGVMVYRPLDPSIEDTNVKRPGITDISASHIRMNIFSPFDDEELFRQMYGYLEAILNDYQLIKEKFILTEIELRDFDESIPVYLSKYNCYFAVSTIQRDKDGVCTVELVKLPRITSDIKQISSDYEVEIVSSGFITLESENNCTIYFKATENSEWQEFTNNRLDFGSEGIYAITADFLDESWGKETVFSIVAKSAGQYIYRYTDADGNTQELSRNEMKVYFDDVPWQEGLEDNKHIIRYSDGSWHKVTMEIPIRNEFDEVVETRRWVSPIFVSKKSDLSGGMEDLRYEVKYQVPFSTLSIGGKPITFEVLFNGSYELWNTEEGNNKNLIVPLTANASTWYAHNYVTLIGYMPRYALPTSQSSSYTFAFDVINALRYELITRRGFDTLSRNELTVKLRTYYDDIRVAEGQNLTLNADDAQGYHIIKFISDLVDVQGNVVKRLRERIIWFVNEVIDEVVESDYGDEHDDDAETKVDTIDVIGRKTIFSTTAEEYIFLFQPQFADIKVKSVTVVPESPTSRLVVSDVTTESFKVTASSLPATAETETLLITATLDDDSTVTSEYDITISQNSIAGLFNNTDMSSSSQFDAPNGHVTKNFSVYVKYANGVQTITSITSSNEAFEIGNIDKYSFDLTVKGISEDTTAQLDFVLDVEGTTITGSLNVTAIMKEMWDTTALDEAGALIVDINGMFYTAEEWKGSGNYNEDADGVAVSDGTHRFVLAKSEFMHNNGGDGTLVSGQYTTNSDTEAITDFAGESNTDAMIAALGESVAHVIRGRMDFASGQRPYYGSAGEWNTIQQHRSRVQSLLASIGATLLNVDSYGCEYLTSTQYGANDEWYYHFGTDNKAYVVSKSNQRRVRSLAPIKILSEPVPKGTIAISGAREFDVINGVGSSNYTVSFGPTGVAVGEVVVTSSNEKVKVTVLSKTSFRLSCSDVIVSEKTVVKVVTRLNNLLTSATIEVTARGESVIDYDRLDEAKVLLIDKNYNLYDADEWVESEKLSGDCEGVALSYMAGPSINKRRRRIVISKDNMNESKNFDDSLNYAKEYVFASGIHGFLGEMEDYEQVVEQIVAINELLEVVYRDKISGTYWTATTYEGNDKVGYRFFTNADLTKAYMDMEFKSRLLMVRPIRVLE